MTVKDYIESFGWQLEECSPEEVREILQEIRIHKTGLIILDGTLSSKARLPNQKKYYHDIIPAPDEIRVLQKIHCIENYHHGFPLLSKKEMKLAVSASNKAEAFFWCIYPDPRDSDFPDGGLDQWFLQFFLSER